MPKYLDGAGLSRFWDNIQDQIGNASQEQVDAWLDAHPEATTTVQDSSITTAKLADGAVTYVKVDSVLADAGFEVVEPYLYQSAQGWKLTGDGLSAYAPGYEMIKYSVYEGMALRLRLSKDAGCVYQWQSEASVPASGTNSGLIGNPVNVATDAVVTAPTGALFLIVCQSQSNTSNVVKQISPLLDGYSDTIRCKNLVGNDPNEYYPVPELRTGMSITFSNADGAARRTRTDIVCYDKDKTRLGDYAFPVGSVTRTVQIAASVNGTRYIRLQNVDSTQPMQIELGGVATSYVPYFGNTRYLYEASSEAGQFIGFTKQRDNTYFSTDYVYFKPIGIYGGIWFKLGNMWLFGSVTNTTAWANLLPSAHETSPDGMADCIHLTHNQCLVFDVSTSDYAIVALANIDAGKHIPIFVTAMSQDSEWVVGGKGAYLYEVWRKSQSPNETTVDGAKRYAALINSSDDTEQFIYFTDPHMLGYSGDPVSFLPKLNKWLGSIAAYAQSIPATFVMCGGDWLNSGDSKDLAKWKLGLIYEGGDKFRRYYNVVGNHDTNQMGVDSGTLTDEEINNAMFGGEHKNYYTFDGSHTRFYVFDSGSDQNNETMTPYRWEQVAWFAEALAADDKPHSAVSIHIWYTSASADTISALATNIASVVSAYNGRTSVTLNGSTYSFSGCTGHTEFVICGHTHVDKSGTSGGIPVINTVNTTVSASPSFDLMYVDYDARQINAVRVGSGSDRTFNLATF